MKKLSKVQEKRLTQLSQQILLAKEALDEEIDTYNGEVAGLQEKVTAAQEDLNDAIRTAAEFTQDIALEISEYMADRSEAWQNGERGQQYAEWQSTWEHICLDEVELTAPEEISIECDVDPEELNSLPLSPDE